MKKLLLPLLMLLALTGNAQSLVNTAFRLYSSSGPGPYYRFTADSVLFSPDNVSYTAQGIYRLSGYDFSIKDKQGGICADTGKYTIGFSGDTLKFTMVSDACYIRAGVLVGNAWVSLTPLGIKAPAARLALRISPNPSTDYILVSAGHIQAAKDYVILSSVGQCVLKGELQGTDTRIDISDLQPGTYYLQAAGTDAMPAFFIKN